MTELRLKTFLYLHSIVNNIIFPLQESLANAELTFGKA